MVFIGAGMFPANFVSQNLGCFDELLPEEEDANWQPSTLPRFPINAPSTNAFMTGSCVVLDHLAVFQSKKGCSRIRHNIWSESHEPIYITLLLNDSNLETKPFATAMVPHPHSHTIL